MDTIVTPVTVITLDSTRIVHSIKADLVARYFPPVVRLVQYDQSLPVIAVSLMKNGQAYTLPNGAAANIRVHKPDATYVYNPALGCDSTRNIVYFEVTQAMAAANGDGLAIVELVVNGDIAGTSLLNLHFEENPVPEDAIESSDEWETIYELGQRIIASTVTPVSNAADMTDTSIVYLYTGTETGWNQGHMYYYNGSSWVDAGIAVTDKTLTVSDMAADAKTVGDRLTTLDSDVANLKASDTTQNADITSLKEDSSNLSDEVEGLMVEYANALPMTYSINNNRIKILNALYRVVGGYIEKVILLKITTNSITSANTWTLGNLVPYANLKTGQAYIDYTATSLSGGDISGMTFRQSSGTSNNFSVVTTGAVSEGQGGVILLKAEQAINSNTNAIADTEYPVKLINDTELSNDLFNADSASANYAWRISSNSLASLSGYSYMMIRVYGGSSIAVHGLSETLGSYGYAVLNSSKTVLASGGETPGMIIDIPDNGYWLIFTYPSGDNISFIPYYKKKVVVLGDSWSDNDPDHTTYTKWTTLLQQDGKYSVKVYAQNGSSISGNTPNYAPNGNVLGQINQLKTDNIDNVDFIIIFGGINDFRSGVSSDTLTSAFLTHLSTLNQMYPNANINCVLNHQVFVTLEQWTYMQTVKRAIRNQTGFPCYTTFGWVKATDFISDYVHPDNDGYQNIYSNMLAIISGGTPLFIPNTGTIEATSSANGAIVLTITELFSNDDFQRKINMNVTGATATGTATVTADRSCGLLANIPFESFPQLIIASLNRAYLSTGITRGTSSPTSSEANKQATSFAVGMAHANYSGDYIGAQIPIM